jgi:hypothetical protein
MTLTWSGPGNALSLTEGTSGTTPTVAISEPTPGVNTLEINLGAGYTFAAGSTTSATGLTYQNAGSPTTSQYATINIGASGNVSSLQATLPGDYLTLGPIRDLAGGVGSITATAGTIEVTGISTSGSNGNVSLTASGNLTVDPSTSVLTGSGTISLAADVNADGSGNNGQGILSIEAGAVVNTTNTSASAITLRGARVNIDTSADPAVVGQTHYALRTTPTATLTGVSGAGDIAFDASGDLFVANYYANTVSEFAPGATTPTATLTGLNGPHALAFDASGDLFVGNYGASGGGNTVTEFAPGTTTPTATLTGVWEPLTLTFDASGNLYVPNYGGSYVSKFAPGATTPTAMLFGVNEPYGVALDSSGDVFVTSSEGATVCEFAPGATTPSATLTGLTDPTALAFDANGNLYVASSTTTLSKFAPGATKPTATLNGVNEVTELAFDASGNLFAANCGGTTVSEFAPGASAPTATLTGLNAPRTLAFDPHGNLFVGNWADPGGTISEFAWTPIGTAGGVVIRSSVASRPMSIGGTSSAVAGINLTGAELAQIGTAVGGSMTIGDSSQTGDITFEMASPAAVLGASTVVVQSPTGPGQIILDDDNGSGTALNGNGGNISISAGTGGIVAASTANGTAEIGTTGAMVTLNTTGPIGAAGSPIQFADDANSAQQVVQIGSSNEPSGVFLDGLGSLTLGEILGATTSAQIDVTARDNLVVAPGAIVDSGTNTLSLGADLNADGMGDDGAGALSIGAGAVVDSTNPTSNAITLRGANVNIDTSAHPAIVGAPFALSTTPVETLTGLDFPYDLAFDASGDLYVTNTQAGTVSKFAPGATTPSATLTGLDYPEAMAFDASGDLFVANASGYFGVSEFAPGATTPTTALSDPDDPTALAFDTSGNLYVANGAYLNNTVIKFAPGSTTPTATLTGLDDPDALAFDASGNLFVANAGGTVSEFAPGATTRTATLTGLNIPNALAFDGSGNLYVVNGNGDTVSKFAPGSTTPTATLTGPIYPTALAIDAAGNVYVANESDNSVSEFAPGATTPTVTFTGLDVPRGLAFDTSGTLYVANSYSTTVSKFVVSNGVPTAGGVVIRSSLPTLPMSIGGTNNGTAGISLTGAELAQIYTTASGTVTFGDSSQTGNITFTTATPATTPGASTVVVQSPTGPGEIILDDAGSGTGLNGNGGTVTLIPGTGGIAAPLSAGGGLPLASRGFNATGLTLSLTLNFPPTPGTQVTLLDNTATPAAGNPIDGTFANLPQGGTISATYNGTPCLFQANYTGGDGNDLVLTAMGSATTTTVSTSQTSVTYGTPVTFTATVTAASGSSAPAAGSVDFFDTTTNTDLGLGAFGTSTGTTSTWTLSTGAKTFNVTTGDTISATYTLGAGFGDSSGTTILTVTARPITVTASAGTKGYDGTTSTTATATVTGGSLVSGDTATFTESFDNRNAGAGKTLNVTGSVSGGNNYVVSFVSNTTGQITARPITVTALTNTKLYDGTTTAVAIPMIPSGSLVSGDTAAFTETYDTPAVGTGKTLTPVGSVNDGNGGNNYSVTSVDNISGAVVSENNATTLIWPGPGNVLSLTDGTSGATPAITISEPLAGISLLKIDLGMGYVFAGGSTASATGLTYQNAGSPTTSEYATIDISSPGNVSSLVATLPGDNLILGPIRDFDGGLGSVIATAGTIEVRGINTLSTNGKVDLNATGNLTVDSDTTIQTGTGTISLAADVNAIGTGDDGAGTLSVGAGAAVQSSSQSAAAITLRGADINIDTSADAAVVGAQRSLSTTRTAMLSGVSYAYALAFDAGGNLYVANYYANTVSEFAPGATTPSAILTGQSGPYALAFDASGNLYVANEQSHSTVNEFAPGATTPTATLTGLSEAAALAFDARGDLYVANNNSTGTVSEFAPGATTPTATLTGLSSPWALAFDPDGNLYVNNPFNNTVSKFGPGATTPTATLTGLDYPDALAVDGRGNLYVANRVADTVSEFAPGATTPTHTLTGLGYPYALAFDASGDLFVGNVTGTVSEFAPGATTPTATLTGPSDPNALAFDGGGNLYVASNATVAKFASGGVARPTAGGAVIRSSLPSRPMSIGGTNNAVNGINLTNAELAQIYTTASGTVTFGDSSQTGNITFTTATPATTPGAATVVVQSPTGPGEIILDDAGSGTGLNGNGGPVTLTPGTGGIVTPLSAAGVPLATQGLNATGLTLTPTLDFAPTLGTQLTVINNTATPAASNPIIGTFADLPQGGLISATYNGTTYWFQANYAGGDGNDLVLTAIAPTITTLGPSQRSVTYGTPVTFTATVSAPGAGSPPIGNVDFYDTTTKTNLGQGIFAGSTGTTSTWTLTPSAKTLKATAGDTITATYTPGLPFAGSSGTTTELVTPLPVTVTGVTAADKTYDGNTTATLQGLAAASFVGVLSGDAVTLGTNGAMGTFASKDVAQNIAVSVSGLTLGGAEAEDYTLTQPSTTANITPATLTVSGITAADKIYNANATATLNTAGAALVGVFSGDAVTLVTSGAAGTFASDGVAQNIAVSVSGLTISGVQAGDYTLTQPTATADITPATLTVSGITAADKVYDGTTAATLDGLGTASLVGVVSGDAVTLDAAGASGTFASRNAGQNLAVSVSGLTLDGAQAADYTLAQLTTTANITPRPITVAAVPNMKIYDGTNSASAVPAIVSGSLVSGDVAAFGETFDAKNVGIGKTLSPVGSVNDGNGGNDYAVALLTSTLGAISPRALTVTAVSNTKAYDGTISAAASPAIIGGSLATGDTAAFCEMYNTPFAGTGLTLSPAGTVNDGNAGANYSVTLVNNTSGAITQAVDHFLLTASPVSVTAGSTFLLSVTAEDADGHVVTGYNGTVEFSSAVPLVPVPAANLTFQAGAGVASTLATLETADSWAITATDTFNASITGASSPVTVTAAAVSKAYLPLQPSSTPAGGQISSSGTALMVDVEDRYGNLVTSYTGNVTMTISSGTLLGTTMVAAVGGVATFNSLSLDATGSYTLTATVAGVGGTATSNSFYVTADSPAKLAFTTQPKSVGGTHTFGAKVAVEDVYGNTVTGDDSSVTLTLNAATSGGGGMLAGTTTVAAVDGVATFSGLSSVNISNPNWSAAGTGYTFTANDTDNGNALPTVTSTAFNTTLIVTSCTMTPTGFTASFSQPIEIATTPVAIGPNLYGAASSGSLPANVSLIGSNEGTIRGSLVVNATDTQITFVATTLVRSNGLPIAGVSSPDAKSGILAPDGYLVTLTATSTSFVTTGGQLLDGNDSGVGGTNFQQFTAVNDSADIEVVIPSFARGPSSGTITSTVNVPNASASIFSTSPISIASSAKDGATESGNTVTITTAAAHGLIAGQEVLISGFTGSYTGYNGTFTVASAPSSTTFTYTDSTTGLGKAGSGTVTGYGLVESGHTATVWTTASQGLAVGQPVTISGAGVSGYNGTFTVASLPGGSTGTTFTYTDPNTGLANSGGGTAALARGIPISISGPTGGVTSGQFTLTYTASDLSVTGAIVDPTLAASYGATLSLDASSTAGTAIIDFKTTTALPAAGSTPILLGGLMATVPSTAYYKATDLLHFSSLSVNTGVTMVGSDALHLVTFQGDGSGDGSITSADGLDISRVVAGADAGFAAYPLTDPDIIADMLSDGAVDGPNGALLGRYINGIATPQLPVYPGAPVNKLSVVGPGVTILSPLQLGSGESAAVPTTVASPSLTELTTSIVAGPVVQVGGGAAANDAGTVSLDTVASAVPAHVSRHVTDGLFAALGSTVDAAESAIPGSGEQAESPALAAQMSAGGSGQANLDSLLWESGDSSWQDGEQDWLL